MSEEINYFKTLPEYIQSSAERQVVDVIYESFVIPGDQDYLMSRLLAQKGLSRGFFWAAAQAIEKYLKAFLLMNGKNVKDFTGHPLKKLFDSAKNIDSSITNLNVEPHPSIIVDPNYSDFIEKFGIVNFINEIEKQGSANNRYNAFGVKYNTGHLLALDSFSFQFREKIGAIGIIESFKKLSPDLILIFEKNNPWFQPDGNQPLYQIPNTEFPLQYSSSVTKLEILINNESNIDFRLALQWLNAKMKLPKTNCKSK